MDELAMNEGRNSWPVRVVCDSKFVETRGYTRSGAYDYGCDIRGRV